MYAHVKDSPTTGSLIECAFVIVAVCMGMGPACKQLIHLVDVSVSDAAASVAARFALILSSFSDA